MAQSGGFSTRALIVALVPVVVVVASALAATRYLGSRWAREATTEALNKSQTLHASFRQQSLDQLRLSAQVVGSVLDFQAPVVAGAETLATFPLLDQLNEFKATLGFDFAIVLDGAGNLLVRTDGVEGGQDLIANPLIANARDRPVLGIWRQGDFLANAVAYTRIEFFEPMGTVVLGQYMDQVMALELRNAATAEIAFLGSGPAGLVVTGTTLSQGASDDLTRALRSQGALKDVLSRVAQSQVELEGQPWQVLLAPLRDPANETVGAVAALASEDKYVGAYRRIEWIVLGAGLLAVVLVGLLSLGTSRGGEAPLKRLAQAVEASMRGRKAALDVNAGGELGRVASMVEGLLQDLGERREFVAYLATTAPDPSDSRDGMSSASPHAADITLLAIELRRFANPKITFDAEQAVERLSREVRHVTSSVTSHRGTLVGVFGHRLVASFDGEGHSLRALATLCEVVPQLSERESAFEEAESPVVALVSGEAVHGCVAVGEGTQQAVLGLPVQQLDTLIREGAPGDILLSQKIHQALAPALQKAGVELSPRRALMTSQAMFLLPLQEAIRIAGRGSAPATVPRVAGGGGDAGNADLGPGSIVGGRYEIVSALSSGGSEAGVAYKARDRQMDEVVLLKVLRGEAWAQPVAQERLRNAVQLATKLAHPNVCRVMELILTGEAPMVVTEYASGLTLRQLLDRSRRMPLLSGLFLAKQLCQGVAAGHAEGLVHGAIAPGSVVVGFSGAIKLLDLGLSSGQPPNPGTASPYLAPEQVQGGPPHPRIDVYACGVILYEALTGEPPFGRRSPDGAGLAPSPSEPAPLSTHQRRAPRVLDEILARCLARQPERRYPDASHLWKDLAGVRVR